MVERLDVEFSSEGVTCQAWLYRADGAGPRPTAFAAAGVNALVFDYRNLGVSDGDNRQHLDPWAQIRDLPERDLVP
jgi:uncharacterized protein